MNNNLKKVISSVAAFAVVASTATAFAGFPDVDESATYVGAVDTLTALGIVEGDDNGKFNPDNSVTRAEFAKMVVEARGEGDAAKSLTTSQFTDAQNHWAVGYIAQATSKGIINGYDDTTFGPDDTVTYAQAVKMLVCAIGYETFAIRAGGWPTGYLSYGGTLDITNGVTGVSTDTALTRAQCAVLINNTLRAPLVVVDGVEWGGLTGTIMQDKLVVKDGVGKDWQTLLTNCHNAYAVKGRVSATPKTSSGALDADQVKYTVEVAENFDGEQVKGTYATHPKPEVYVGSTKAVDMLFEYSEAIIQKDKETEEYTLISVTPYGSSRTEQFAAADVAETTSGSDLSTNDEKKIAVYKSETSTAVSNYKLENNAKLYVNGVEVGTINDTDFNDYIIDNPVGTVTLVDSTETGSTSTNGRYDYINVDYYRDAVVSYVSEGSNGNNTVYFNSFDNKIKSKMSWDAEDEDKTVKFIKDGAEISVTDLKENDILSISYDVKAPDFGQSSFYEVLVSDNTVTGKITSKDDTNEKISLDGEEYEGTLVDVTSLDAKEYTFYLNAFGYIAMVEEGDSSKNYGIVVGMYDSNSEDFAVVRMVTADGSIKAFVCKDEEEEDNFAKVLQGAAAGALGWDELLADATKNPANKTAFNKEEVFNGYPYQSSTVAPLSEGIKNNVCTYKTSSTGIRLDDTVADLNMNAVVNGEYKASSSKLSSYALSEATTVVLDVQSYLLGKDSAPTLMSVSSFVEETGYDGAVYDKSKNDGTYRFVILTNGTSVVNVNTALAVVEKTPVNFTDEDGEDFQKVLVSREGNTNVEVVFEDGVADGLQEGDVITYVPNSNGVVSSYDLIMSIDSSYADFVKAALAEGTGTTDFYNNIKNAEPWSSDADVEVKFGMVYKKTNNNIELLTTAEDVTFNDTATFASNVNATEDFTIDADTNIMVYDYSERAGKGARVYSATGMPSISNSIFKPAVFGNNDEYVNIEGARAIDSENFYAEIIKADDVTPSFAFVKSVNDDVTDIVYIVAE